MLLPPLPIVVVLEPGAARHASLEAARERAGGGVPLLLLSCGPGDDLPPAWTGLSHVQDYTTLLRRRRQDQLEALAAPLRREGHAVTTVDGTGPDAATTLRLQLEGLGPALVVKETRSDAFSRWHRLTDQVLLQQRRHAVLLVGATLDGERLPGAERLIPRGEEATGQGAPPLSAVPESSAPAAPATRRASSP